MHTREQVHQASVSIVARGRAPSVAVRSTRALGLWATVGPRGSAKLTHFARQPGKCRPSKVVAISRREGNPRTAAREVSAFQGCCHLQKRGKPSHGSQGSVGLPRLLPFTEERETLAGQPGKCQPSKAVAIYRREGNPRREAREVSAFQGCCHFQNREKPWAFLRASQHIQFFFLRDLCAWVLLLLLLFLFFVCLFCFYSRKQGIDFHYCNGLGLLYDMTWHDILIHYKRQETQSSQSRVLYVLLLLYGSVMVSLSM